MKAIIISDDLTGAAEVAGAALRLGMSADVHIGQVYHSDADVIAVDADTRSLSPSAAALVVNRITKKAMESSESILIKKVDSVLRGPVLAEIDAMLSAAQLDRCILICGNPRKRRFILNGEIFLDGVPLHATEFASDPEHPRTTSNAIELLRNGSSFEGQPHCKSIDRTLRVVNPTESFRCGIAIGSVCDSEQLRVYADHWIVNRESVLAAGAAEFIEVILQNCIEKCSNSGSDGGRLALTGRRDRMLLVAGTRNPHDEDWPVVLLQGDYPLSEHVANVCEALDKDGRAAIRIMNASNSTPELLLRRLTQIAKKVLIRSSPDEIWIEGGRTSSTLLRELGHEQLTAVSNLGDGIVALRAKREAAPLFIVKPGSYPWSDVQRLALRSYSIDRMRDTA